MVEKMIRAYLEAGEFIAAPGVFESISRLDRGQGAQRPVPERGISRRSTLSSLRWRRAPDAEGSRSSRTSDIVTLAWTFDPHAFQESPVEH
jgi:hypothetical protein